MLRRQVGDDAFWRGIRDYYARYRNRNASRADFERVMEEASGQDLRWFFTQWLMRAGSPAVRGTWRYDEVTKRVEVALDQTQPGDEYRLPFDIGVTAAGPMRIERVVLAARSGHFTIASDTRPTAVVLDPNTWTLMDAAFSEADR
jgi:aminopeptidase N